MRFAHAVLLCATSAVAQVEPAQRIQRLIADLRVEAKAAAAITELVGIGETAVPALAAALTVLPEDTLDNQAWKEGALSALEQLGPLAREAGAEILVAAFKLPLTQSEKAFAALAAVGPAAHVRLTMTDCTISASATVNGIRIPGSGDRVAVMAVVRRISLVVRALSVSAREFEEVQQLLANKSPPAAELARLQPLLQDMTRQALVTALHLPDLKQETDALAVARALQLCGADPAAEEAHALLLIKGTAEEQLAAARVLGHVKTRSRHVVSALRKALRNADLRIVREAITALGMTGELAAEAAAELKELSTHADPQIAARAGAALRASGH